MKHDNTFNSGNEFANMSNYPALPYLTFIYPTENKTK